MNTKRNLLIASLVICVTNAFASQTTDLLEKIKRTYPNIAFTEVNETPVVGIYEAVFGKDILYVESTGTYFFPTMVNMITRANLGDERRNELNKVSFSELPTKDAFKTVIGNGSRQMAVFSDPNCVYCKKLEGELAKLKDVTIYTFPVGILGPDSVRKAHAVSCAKGDKSAIWKTVVLENAKIPDNNCVDSPVDRNLALFQKLGFQGTPSIVMSSGVTIKGYAEAPRLEEMLVKK